MLCPFRTDKRAIALSDSNILKFTIIPKREGVSGKNKIRFAHPFPIIDI